MNTVSSPLAYLSTIIAQPLVSSSFIINEKKINVGSQLEICHGLQQISLHFNWIPACPVTNYKWKI